MTDFNKPPAENTHQPWLTLSSSRCACNVSGSSLTSSKASSSSSFTLIQCFTSASRERHWDKSFDVFRSLSLIFSCSLGLAQVSFNTFTGAVRETAYLLPVSLSEQCFLKVLPPGFQIVHVMIHSPFVVFADVRMVSNLALPFLEVINFPLVCREFHFNFLQTIMKGTTVYIIIFPRRTLNFDTSIKLHFQPRLSLAPRLPSVSVLASSSRRLRS